MQCLKYKFIGSAKQFEANNNDNGLHLVELFQMLKVLTFTPHSLLVMVSYQCSYSCLGADWQGRGYQYAPKRPLWPSPGHPCAYTHQWSNAKGREGEVACFSLFRSSENKTTKRKRDSHSASKLWFFFLFLVHFLEKEIASVLTYVEGCDGF